MLRSQWRRVRAALSLCAAASLAGCSSDALSAAPDQPAVDRVAVVLNRGDGTLSLIPFDEAAPRRAVVLNRGSGAIMGANVAVNGERALVGMGSVVLVTNLRTRSVERMIQVTTAAVERVLFLSDTLAVASSPMPGLLTLFNPETGRVGTPSTEGGRGAVDLLHIGDRILVLGAGPEPGRSPGTVTVLDLELRRVRVVQLSGSNPRALKVRGSNVYVLNAGEAGQTNGSVSMLDLAVTRELSSTAGFGESPESMAFSTRGEYYVALPGRGLVVYAPETGTFLRGPSLPLSTGGLAAVSRLAMDPAGFVYALLSGSCEQPGSLVMLDASGAPTASAPTGVCPADVQFTSLTRR